MKLPMEVHKPAIIHFLPKTECESEKASKTKYKTGEDNLGEKGSMLNNTMAMHSARFRLQDTLWGK